MSITDKQQRRLEQQELLRSIQSNLVRKIYGEQAEGIYSNILHIIVRGNIVGDFEPMRDSVPARKAKEIFDHEILKRLNEFTNPTVDSKSKEFCYLLRKVYEFCSDIVFGPRTNPYED